MKTVAEFIADWKVYGDEKEFVAALWHFQSEAYAAGVERDLQEIERLRKELELEKMRRDRLKEVLRDLVEYLDLTHLPKQDSSLGIKCDRARKTISGNSAGK
jgi:HAMP domain-containing protein